MWQKGKRVVCKLEFQKGLAGAGMKWRVSRDGLDEECAEVLPGRGSLK